MSGIKDNDLTLFYRKLHDRPKKKPRTVAQIAEAIFSSRAHVTEVLNGNRPGGQTWRKLARVLTPAEMALLGRDERGEKLPDVPQATLSHVEHQPAA